MLDPRQSRRAERALRAFLHTPLRDAARARRRSAAAALALFHDVAATVPAYAQFLREQDCDPAGIRTAARLRARAARDQGQLPAPPSVAEPVPGGRLERERLRRRVLGLDRRADLLAALRGRRARRSRPASSTCSTTPSRRRTPHARRRVLRARKLGRRHVHERLLPAPRRQGLSADGGHAGQSTRGDLARRARARAALRADRAARLSAVPQGRARRRPRRRHRLVRTARSSSSWRAKCSARSGATWSPNAARCAIPCTTRRRSTAPPTPACSATRRRSACAYAAYLSAHPDAARALFGQARLPTLVQYDPHARYFETVCRRADEHDAAVHRRQRRAAGALPHRRSRRCRGFDEMSRFLDQCGFDPRAALPATTPVRALPFVYVFGRTHFAVSFFGANVYPENVSVGLGAARAVPTGSPASSCCKSREGVDDCAPPRHRGRACARESRRTRTSASASRRPCSRICCA